MGWMCEGGQGVSVGVSVSVGWRCGCVKEVRVWRGWVWKGEGGDGMGVGGFGRYVDYFIRRG